MILKWIRRQQSVIILICLIIIGVCFPVLFYAKASLPELIQRNTNDSHMLTLMLLVEMDAEAGSDYIGAKNDYADILKKHLARMEERSLSQFLGLMYPELSPRKQLTSALTALNKPITQQDQAANEIENSRQIIARFVSNLQKSAGTQILTLKPEDLPEELLNDVKSALDNSKKSVERYMVDQNIASAQAACRKNRIAISLAYLSRVAYKDFSSLDDELKQFRGDINRSIYYSDLLRKNNADLLANDPLPDVREQLEKDNDLLKKYTKSELRRLEIVDTLLERDNQKAEALVRNTIGISGSK